MNSLVAELANVTAVEQVLLGQCKDLLSTVTALHVSFVLDFDFMDIICNMVYQFCLQELCSRLTAITHF